MIQTRGLMRKVVAAAAAATAAVVTVVAASFALYAALKPEIGPAWAAAAVAAIAMIAAWVLALVFRAKAPEDRRRAEEPVGFMERATDLVRERPLMAAAAAAAAGWIFIRNPALATVVAAALSEKNRGRH